MSRREILILLNMVDGLGLDKIKVLLNCFKDISGIFTQKDRLNKILGKQLADRVFRLRDEDSLAKEVSSASKRDISIVTIVDEDYPLLLRQIYYPPIVLYVKGDKKVLRGRSLSVVGSRKASSYGLGNAGRFGYDLACAGFNVVSGLALGIDAAAHRGCLQASGKTVAVLGSGLSCIYPYENIALSEKISEAGCLVSEFPLQTRPSRENFPRRNRIISGLSVGVLIVEAAKRSGALITANFALDQGKEVFALPGRLDSQVGKGVNSLLKDGAVLVERVEDILESLHMDLPMNNRFVTRDK